MKQKICRARNAMDKFKKGFSILEVLLVVMVGAVIVVGSLEVYKDVRDRTYVSGVSTMALRLKEASFNLYSGYPNFSGLSNDVLISNGFVPEKYIGTSSTIKHSTGATYIVDPQNGGRTVQVRIYNYDLELCGQIVTAIVADPDLVWFSQRTQAISIATHGPITPADAGVCKTEVEFPSIQGLQFRFSR